MIAMKVPTDDFIIVSFVCIEGIYAFYAMEISICFVDFAFGQKMVKSSLSIDHKRIMTSIPVLILLML